MKNGSKKGFLIVKLRFAFLPTTFIVYPALVHCRIGSLETETEGSPTDVRVHCRIGSLEIYGTNWHSKLVVHCRIGSLEN